MKNRFKKTIILPTVFLCMKSNLTLRRKQIQATENKVLKQAAAVVWAASTS
jgi:hypothetical protein